jgi:hypothetical protein
MIAEKGESLAPIGRWKAPIERLIARKLMMKMDAVNAVITIAGRAALKEENAGTSQDMAVALNKDEIGRILEEAATVVATATKYVAAMTNSRPSKWADLVHRRVLELVPQHKMTIDHDGS